MGNLLSYKNNNKDFFKSKTLLTIQLAQKRNSTKVLLINNLASAENPFTKE
ncbi:MAG: hypothetical protein K0U41_01860 [Gammaproteobacteria bacterium]|nr:hypothetical protein [Gammaproteobacteria bacterium]